MNQPKVYRQESDIYGETYVTVNGKLLLTIGYHQPYDTCDEDLALTILADYFEEEPTKDILDRGEAKCWKFHKDFARELVSGGDLIWSQDIKLWLEIYNNKEQSGIDLFKLFGPIAFYRTFIRNTEQKIYHFVRDIDDSIGIFANDELLAQIRYHQLSDDFCVEDMALTILADYFKENPTSEQISRGESQCWELHLDFANEMVLRGRWAIFDTQIKSWIDQRIGKTVLENELIKLLEILPIPIVITKEESSYTWKLLNKIDTVPTFINAIQDAFENLIDELK